MTWGNDTDATSAREQLELFVDKGGTLVDTAASYVGGDSEKLLGQLLTKHISRREVVLVSKAGVRSWRAWALTTWICGWCRSPTTTRPWRRPLQP